MTAEDDYDDASAATHTVLPEVNTVTNDPKTSDELKKIRRFGDKENTHLEIAVLGKQSIDYQVKFIAWCEKLVFKNGDSDDDDIIHLIAQGFNDVWAWFDKVEETLFTDSIRDYALGLRMLDFDPG